MILCSVSGCFTAARCWSGDIIHNTHPPQTISSITEFRSSQLTFWKELSVLAVYISHLPVTLQPAAGFYTLQDSPETAFWSFCCGSAGEELDLVSLRMWVPSLASLSGLRIRRCCNLRRRFQIWLRSCVAVTVAQASSCSFDLPLAWEYAKGMALKRKKKLLYPQIIT